MKKKIKETNLDDQYKEKSLLQQQLLQIKQNIAEKDKEFENKIYKIRNTEKQLQEITENLEKMKKNVTKKSEELLSDKTIELQAVQFQLDKAREEIIKLNKINLEKENNIFTLNQSIQNTENEILNKEKKLNQFEQEIEKNNNELGQIEAQIQLKNNELSRIQSMIKDYNKQKEEMIKQNKENIKLDIADIEQELNEKNNLLQQYNLKYNDIVQEIKDKEIKLKIIEETIKKEVLIIKN